MIASGRSDTKRQYGEVDVREFHESVAVHPDQRRHGLGGRLVRIIEQRLRERGCPKVNLIEKEL